MLWTWVIRLVKRKKVRNAFGRNHPFVERLSRGEARRRWPTGWPGEGSVYRNGPAQDRGVAGPPGVRPGPIKRRRVRSTVSMVYEKPKNTKKFI